MPGPTPPAGTIHQGGVEVRLIDGHQSPQQQEDREGKIRPDLGEDHDDHRQTGIRQPRRAVEPEELDDSVDRSELAVEEDPEHHGRRHVRDDVGRHGHRPQEAEPPQHPEEGEGEEEAQRGSHDQGSEDEEGGSVQRVPERRRREHVRVVLDSHPLHGCPQRRWAEQALPDAVEDGEAQDGGHQEDGREAEEIGRRLGLPDDGVVVSLGRPVSSPPPAAAGPGDRRRRHRSSTRTPERSLTGEGEGALGARLNGAPVCDQALSSSGWYSAASSSAVLSVPTTISPNICSRIPSTSPAFGPAGVGELPR